MYCLKHIPITILYCAIILTIACGSRPIPVNIILLRDSKPPGLYSLSLTTERLSPEFSPFIHYYRVKINTNDSLLQIKAEPAEPELSIMVEGEPLNMAGYSIPIEIRPESTRIIHIEIFQDETPVDLYRIEIICR